MKLGRWVLAAFRMLAVPIIAAILVLHYDTSLAHRLGSVRVGAVTVAAAVSVMLVAFVAWSSVKSLVDALQERFDEQFTPVSVQNERSLSEAAEDLGVTLLKSAKKEIENRGLLNPEPLPVRWRRVVVTGPDGTALEGRGPERVDPLEQIAGAVRGSKMKRFVLIGEPGSGKTAVTLFLQRDLIDQDASGPIPLALPLSTWNTDIDLLDWAAARLEERIPRFARPLSSDSPDSVAKQLLHGKRIRLILDGMDELPDDLLARVFSRINDKGADFPVIITCRTADYRRAARGAGAAGESCELANALVFQLLAPRTEVVEKYLGGTQAKGRWDRVFASLQKPGSPVAEALNTPLMVWLAHRVYQDSHPNLFADKLARGDFANPEAVKNHLLDGFIPAVYKDHDAARKERFFRFIAEHVTARAKSKYQLPSDKGLLTMVDDGQDIAWWRLVADRRARLTDRLLLIIVGGLIPGGCVGLCWATSTWNWLPRPAPLVSGLVLGIATTASMSVSCLRNDPPPTGTQFSRLGNVKVSVIVMGCAFFVGSAASLAMSGDLTNALYSLIVAMPVALAYAFTNPYVDAARVETPVRHYRADIQQTLVYTAAYGLGVGVIVAIYRPWPLALTLGLMAGVTGGFTYGAVYKIAYGRNMPPGMVAWIRFRVVHFRLALTGKLPWRYFAFLEDAHRLGVLRQTAGNYQFSHISLRDRLALPAEARKQVTG